VSARRPTEAELVRLRELVAERTGLNVKAERNAAVEHAVAAALERWSLPSVGALCERISAPGGAEVLDALVPALTINETHFFRSRYQMEALDRHVLPALIARRGEASRLRLWSAACATGEEAYTLAILADRHLRNRPGWDVSILGTDIDPHALAHAHRAVYGSWSFREVPRYARAAFERRDSGLHVIDRIRELVTFRPLNLVEDPYPSTGMEEFDLVLCRNVLMYLRPQSMCKALARVGDAVAAGGWLLVAAAELPLAVPAGFAARTFCGAIVHEKVEAPASPPRAHVGRRAIEPRVQPRARRPLATAEAPAPDPLEALQRAKVHAARQELESAGRWLQVALAGRPHDPACHYLHGLLLHAEGSLEESLAAQRRCLYAAPDFALAHVAMAAVEVATGEPERARRSLRRVGRMLASRPEHESVPEGDGLTVAGLKELVNTQRRLLEQRALSATTAGSEGR
jgi:chemotaxis protein methyltransferase CheR